MKKLMFATILSFIPQMAAGKSNDDSTACYKLLTNDFSTDARSFQIPSDRYDHILEDGGSALAVAQLVASDLGCAEGALTQNINQSGACKEIIPGNSFSNVCFVETNLGYFTVHQTLPDSLMITFSRWD